MAEIDDALPNVVTEDTDIELQETEVAVPGEENCFYRGNRNHYG